MPPKAGLRKLADTRPPISSDEKCLETLRGDVPGRRIEDVGLKAQALGAAEHVAVFPIDLALGSVRRRIFHRCAECIGQTVLDVDLVGEATVSVERRPLDDAHAANGRNLADALPRIGDRRRRVRVARMDIEKRAHDRGIEGLRPLDRRFAERRDGAGGGGYRYIHNVLRVVDDRRDGLDFCERPSLLAKIVDDAGLSSADLACGSRISGFEPDDARRKLGVSELHAERVDNTHIAKLEQGAGLDLDDDRGGAAIAISLGGAREGGDFARADGEARAVDRNRHAGVVITRAPEGVDDRREIALGASREGFAVGRGVLAQAVERRSVSHCVFEPGGVASDFNGQRVWNGSPGNLWRLVVGAKEPKEIKSLGDGPVAHHHRAGAQRDNQTDAEATTLFYETTASQLNALFPD